MAGLALHIGFGVRAGMPLICGVFVTGTAQVSIRLDGHLHRRMIGLEWAMAGLAAHTFFAVSAILSVESGGVALQTACLLG